MSKTLLDGDETYLSQLDQKDNLVQGLLAKISSLRDDLDAVTKERDTALRELEGPKGTARPVREESKDPSVMAEIRENIKRTFGSLKNYDQYQKFCDLAATSNLSANNLAAVLAVNQNAVEVGTMQYWNNRRQSIIPQEKGIPIMLMEGRNLNVGHVYDYAQTQPSASAMAEQLPPYQHKYPLDDSKASGFFDLWRKCVTDVRVIDSEPNHNMTEKSHLNGAAIKINTDITPLEQVQQTLYQYYRHAFSKQAGGQEQKPETEIETRAATAAYIAGKKLGFTMPQPHQLAKPDQFSLSTIKDMDKAMDSIVKSARSLHDSLSREASQQLIQQAKEGINLGRQM